MKGLLVKDIRFLMGQKASLLVCLGLGVYFLLTGADLTYAMVFSMMMAALLSTSSISYDAFDNGMAFLLTLPIQKTTYVVSKYIVSILVAVVCGAAISVAAVICNALGVEGVDLSMLGGGLVMAVIMAVVLLTIMIPIYIIFGGEKARFAMMAIFGIAVAVGYIFSRIFGDMEEKIDSLIVKLEAMSNIQLALTGLGVMVVLFAISIGITIKVLERKEY
ncbi:MAG: ABC-2 transporter permease [Lachnospiraceae bacterium]|nr:ABC-2 transporter permease [Lachnospiraceae bacterium]